MKIDYLLLDVFTRKALTGNPLAVVRDADGLLDDQMQRIANELHLRETVFIRKPKVERHTASIRIFTPLSELPFAGHPTVGAAVVLGLEHKTSAVRIEEQIGLVTCVIEKVDRRTGHARFALPHLPLVAGKTPDKNKVALALGIEPEDIGWGPYKPSVHTAGVVYYLVPVRNAAVLARLGPVWGGWKEVFPLPHHSVYAYTATPDEEDNQFAARMFTPDLGEDAATGSAAAALIGPLSEQANDGASELVIRQGAEMGRRSRIEVQIRKDGEQLTHGAIGGDAVVVGQGSLEFD